MISRVYFRFMGIDNNVDWTVPSTPHGEQYGAGFNRKPEAGAAANKASVPATKRSVMDKILGENTLTAIDAGGADPYNTTGRQFRHRR